MKTARIKIYRGLQNVNAISDNALARRLLVRAMLGALGALAFLYVVIIGMTVFHIVARKNFERQVHALSSDVGELEQEYLALSKSVNVELSHTMGFTEAHPNFATTKKSLGRADAGSNEI